MAQILQNGRVIFTGDDLSIGVMHNNISGRNFKGCKMKHNAYLRMLAADTPGFVPGDPVEIVRDGQEAEDG